VVVLVVAAADLQVVVQAIVDLMELFIFIIKFIKRVF
jgi:hypothetical protein